MKALLLFLSVLVLGLAQETSTPAPVAKPIKKPEAQPHESSLKQENAEQPQEQGQQQEYRQLEPDEVRALLLKVVDENVDKDKDGQVTVEELKDWLHVLQEKVIQDNVERQWAYYNPQTEEVFSWEGYYPEQKQVVTWERYTNFTYPDEALKEEPVKEEIKELKKTLKRAERRWQTVDTDSDLSLSKEELRDFLFPEESQTAGGVVVLEAMEDMDVDGNGEISFDEYMNHLALVSGPEKDEPHWGEAQQGHFANFLDKNKDGALSSDELKEWVIPSYDKHEAEAWRYMSLADTNQDSKLSKDEIGDNHETFAAILPPEYWGSPEVMKHNEHDEF